MKRYKYGILIGASILLSCNRQLKFEKKNWGMKDDMEYPLRDRMLEDLTTNYKLVGLKYSAIIALLDEPQYEDSSSFGYDIYINYNGIDPGSGKELNFTFDKDSMITSFKVDNWKH